MHQRTALVF